MTQVAVAAVILAAGAGRRMGQPKAQIQVGGETLVRRAVKAALEAGCSPVVAVVSTGSPNPGLRELGLADLPVRLAFNAEAAEGLASSIRTGVAVLPPEALSVLMLAVDQPAVDAALLRRLLALQALDPDRPAACAYGSTLGVPAVLPRRVFPDLQALQGDRGAKAILQREGAAALPFPAGEADLDTPEDLARLRR